MALKMKELMALSDESKSTILYYIKEGLLPEPSKPKPNVHLYDESCVQILKFIKYLQNNFSYSISDIQTIFSENRFDFDDSFDMMVRSLELLSASKGGQCYSKQEFVSLLGIDETKLKHFQQKKYLFEKAKGFSDKELEIAEILLRAERLGLDSTLLDAYVTTAKALADKENDAGSKLLENETQAHDERYELLFDLVLTLKPYIFNMHTVEAHQTKVKRD